MTSPSSVFTSTSASRPRLEGRCGDLEQVGRVRTQLRPAAARRPRWPPRRSPRVALGRVREDLATALEVGTARVDLERGDGAPASAAAASRELVDAASPDRGHDRRAARARAPAGRARATPRRPGPARPTAFTMCSPEEATRGARVARPGEGRERLGDDGTEAAQVAVARELVAVTRGSRRRQDGRVAAKRPRRAVARLVIGAAPGAYGRASPCSRVSAMPFAAANPALSVVRHGTAVADAGRADRGTVASAHSIPRACSRPAGPRPWRSS